MNKMNKIMVAILLCGVGSANVFAQEMVSSGYLGLSEQNAASDAGQDHVPARSLEALLSNKIEETGRLAQEDKVNGIRSDALTEIATNLGETNGLQSWMKEKEKEINRYAGELDQLFDFRKLTISNGVMAPVLEEGQAGYAQHSPDEVRFADKTYRIVRKAQFVSVYPTWRDYVRFTYPVYDLPPGSFLPKNASEKAIWDKAVKEGWKKGVKQAENIFNASYNRLERDYAGMNLYKILLSEGIVTPTLIAGQNLGVTGGGTEMSINDQVMRITDHSALNPNKSDWNVKYPVSNKANGQIN